MSGVDTRGPLLRLWLLHQERCDRCVTYLTQTHLLHPQVAFQRTGLLNETVFTRGQWTAHRQGWKWTTCGGLYCCCGRSAHRREEPTLRGARTTYPGSNSRIKVSHLLIRLLMGILGKGEIRKWLRKLRRADVKVSWSFLVWSWHTGLVTSQGYCIDMIHVV